MDLAALASSLAHKVHLETVPDGAAHGGSVAAGMPARQLAASAGVAVGLARVGDAAVVALDSVTGVAGCTAYRVTAAVRLGAWARGLAARSRRVCTETPV
jgi:hypothetical protein